MDRNPPTLLYERKIKLGKKVKKLVASSNDSNSPVLEMRIREYEMPFENKKIGTLNLKSISRNSAMAHTLK